MAAQVGAPLCEHADVNCIAFTGSTAVGAIIGSQAVKTMKRIQLELGGKNPLIVCADVANPGATIDVDKAARQACMGAFFHAGQICMASSRIIVEK
jgi:acyl-CoA reductase-like NAD-dependent aldehyde dehydrogenase